jgi:opacity protein-like surface antigen
MLKRACVMALGLVLCSGAAFAQAGADGYVQGIAGIGGAAEQDWMAAGGAAVRVRNRLEVFGEVGRFENAIWNDLNDELTAAGEVIRAQIGTQFGTSTPFEFQATVSTYYGVGGVRVRGPRLGPLGTYVEGGVGMARVRPQVSLTVAGERLDAEARRLLALEDPRAELLTLAGGGVSVEVLSRIRLEGGYRFSRVHGDLPFNINRVHGGIGYAF